MEKKVKSNKNSRNTFNSIVKKRFYMYVFFILIISIVSLTSLSLDTFALWYETNNQPNDNLISTGCFNIEFNDLDEHGDSTSIKLLNTYPITDAKGVKLKPYTFTLKNVCNIKGEYRIVLSRLSNSDMDNKFLRYTFTKNDGALIVNPMPLESTTALDNSLEAIINERNNPKTIVDNYVLEEGYIEPNEENTYYLRIWMNEEADNSQMEKTFEGVVSISSIASY